MGMAADPRESPSVQLIVASNSFSSTSQGPGRIGRLAPSPSRYSTFPVMCALLVISAPMRLVESVPDDSDGDSLRTPVWGFGLTQARNCESCELRFEPSVRCRTQWTAAKTGGHSGQDGESNCGFRRCTSGWSTSRRWSWTYKPASSSEPHPIARSARGLLASRTPCLLCIAQASARCASEAPASTVALVANQDAHRHPVL